MKYIIVKFITFYQTKISVWRTPSCKFYPTCSEYAKEVINKHGALEGLRRAIFRILRCHPWQKNQIDLVK